MFTLKIYTTDKSLLLWPTLDDKLTSIKTALESAKNSQWHISIEYKDWTPEVVNERITHRWFDSIRGNLNDFVVLHMSEQKRKAFGIKPSLRGSNHIDKDSIGEMYMWADEDTKRGHFNQFVQTMLHEIRHEICRGTKTPDNTHELHGQNRDIRPHFKEFDMADYRPRRQALTKTLRQALIAIVKKLVPKKKYKKYPDELRPLVQEKADMLVAAFAAAGKPIRITEGVRSCARQDALYAQGRTKPGNIVTNARCGESMHQYGIAFDVVFREEGYNVSDAQWEALGYAGEAIGLEWGGRWPGFVDRPHFQMKLGHTMADLQSDNVDWSKWHGTK